MIIRIEKTKGYSVIANELAKRSDVSARAKGIYFYLMTLPDDWKLYKRELYTHFTEGRDAISKAFNELKDLGYITKNPERDDSGRIIGWDYTVHESVQNLQSTERLKNRRTEKPSDGESATTKYSLKQNTYSTKNIYSPARQDRIPYADIVDILNRECGTRFKSSGEKTRKLIRARWNDGFRTADFESVARKKAAQWLGSEMEKFLRPITLFGTKFESYLNEKEEKNGRRKTDPWESGDYYGDRNVS